MTSEWAVNEQWMSIKWAVNDRHDSHEDDDDGSALLTLPTCLTHPSSIPSVAVPECPRPQSSTKTPQRQSNGANQVKRGLLRAPSRENVGAPFVEFLWVCQEFPRLCVIFGEFFRFCLLIILLFFGTAHSKDKHTEQNQTRFPNQMWFLFSANLSFFCSVLCFFTVCEFIMARIGEKIEQNYDNDKLNQLEFNHPVASICWSDRLLLHSIKKNKKNKALKGHKLQRENLNFRGPKVPSMVPFSLTIASWNWKGKLMETCKVWEQGVPNASPFLRPFHIVFAYKLWRRVQGRSPVLWWEKHDKRYHCIIRFCFGNACSSCLGNSLIRSRLSYLFGIFFKLSVRI